MRFSLLIQGSPSASQSPFSAYEFATAALAQGHSIQRAFFYQDAVLIGNKLVATPQDEFDIQGYELEALKGMPNHLKIAEYIYLEVNFEEVYLGCSQIKDIDKFLLKFGFMRVGIRKTDKGWGDAIYSKNNILIAKLYYLFLPLIRIVKFPITISRFFIRTFIKR